MNPPPTVFVSEYVCGGAWPGDDLDGTLAAEGRTMLLTLLADTLHADTGEPAGNTPGTDPLDQEAPVVPGLAPDPRQSPVPFRFPRAARVRTTWDDRLGEFPWHEVGDSARSRLTVIPVRRSSEATPDTEYQLFRREVARADAVVVIAPEFFRILETRTRDVEDLAPGRLIGCSSDSVRLCADKLRLADFLPTIGVPTVETRPFDPRQPATDWPFPIVIKPRDGAGSLLTFRVDSRSRFAAVAEHLRRRSESFQFIQQPFLTGRPLSGAAWISGTFPNRVVTVLPTGERHLSDDGQLRDLGVRFPGSVTPRDHQATARMIRRCCAAMPGLSGHVGFDLIVTVRGLRLVEINPRLTTSWTHRRQSSSFSGTRRA